MTRAIWKRQQLSAREVEILGFTKTDNVEAMAIVSMPDGRVLEVRLHELRTLRETPEGGGGE